jgi:hypothetical protein
VLLLSVGGFGYSICGFGGLLLICAGLVQIFFSKVKHLHKPLHDKEITRRIVINGACIVDCQAEARREPLRDLQVAILQLLRNDSLS